jgi:hypothetical protein
VGVEIQDNAITSLFEVKTQILPKVAPASFSKNERTPQSNAVTTRFCAAFQTKVSVIAFHDAVATPGRHHDIYFNTIRVYRTLRLIFLPDDRRKESPAQARLKKKFQRPDFKSISNIRQDHFSQKR